MALPASKVESNDIERERADLLAAIDEGIAQADRGETRDGEEVFKEIRADLIRRYGLTDV